MLFLMPTGPIYVGKDAKIMEGSLVRGPLAMYENSVLKMRQKFMEQLL